MKFDENGQRFIESQAKFRKTIQSFKKLIRVLRTDSKFWEVSNSSAK